MTMRVAVETAHRNSMEVFSDAVFATLSLKGCDSKVHQPSLNGKLDGIASKAQQAILAWLARLLGDVAQVPCQSAPVDWPVPQCPCHQPHTDIVDVIANVLAISKQHASCGCEDSCQQGCDS